MVKIISVGYVQGYEDASAETHKMNTNALRDGGHPVKILDRIICDMYKQQETITELHDELDEQQESEDMFTDIPDDYNFESQDIVDELLRGAKDATFSLTINGRIGDR